MQEGCEKLKQEIEHLSTVRRCDVADRIRVAREFATSPKAPDITTPRTSADLRQRTLTTVGDDEAGEDPVLRDPGCWPRASLERRVHVHLDCVVPDEQAAIDDVEVPLVQAPVTSSLTLISAVFEYDDAARSHDVDHVGDDGEWIRAVVE